MLFYLYMFKNKVVLITGGSSGIGKSTALLFAKKGADVIITYKNNKNGARAVADEIIKIGRKSLAIKANLSEDKNAKMVIKKTISAFGKIDILINNAGGYIEGDEWNLKSKTWIDTLKQNLVSAMSMSKYATEIFQKQANGIIVNVSSRYGILGNYDSISYGASKAGIINITQAYSKLLSLFGGRVNSISPTSVKTGYWLTASKSELKEKLLQIPNHKLLMPNEVAAKIVYLASDKAKNINGKNFLIE